MLRSSQGEPLPQLALPLLCSCVVWSHAVRPQLRRTDVWHGSCKLSRECIARCHATACGLSGEIGGMLPSTQSVLVAEDNEDIRELVSHQLRRMGILVLLAEDGRRALDLALAQRPTLVLMDMDMPVMSGFDAVAALRAQGYRGSIFALTAYQDGPEAERALSSG